KIEGKPAVLIAELPKEENDQFRLKKYGLYALKHAHNNGLLFNKFRVPKENLLKPPLGDGLTIAYHGLNLGRISLCAGAAGSEAQKEAAIELFMKTHGGRSFLKGHPLGDNVHEFLAPCIYEGEGEMLGMAFFKSLVKEHGRQFFEPIGKALQKYGMKTLSPS